MVKLDAVGSDLHGFDHTLLHTSVKGKHNTTISFHSKLIAANTKQCVEHGCKYWLILIHIGNTVSGFEVRDTIRANIADFDDIDTKRHWLIDERRIMIQHLSS